MIRGKKRMLVPAKELAVQQNISIHNKFELEVVDVKTGVTKGKALAYNVICDQLYNYLLQPTAYAKQIHFGSGSGTPSTTDTALFHFEGNVALSDIENTEFGYDYQNGVFWCRRMAQINPEVAVGVNITEVGIAQGAGQNTLCTHALLEDMNGNPISIQKTDTDLINVYVTIFLHTQQSEVNPYVWFPKKTSTGTTKGAEGSAHYSATNFMRWLFGVYYLDSTFYAIKNMQCVLQPGVNPPALNNRDAGAGMAVNTFAITFDKTNKRIVFPAVRFGVNAGNLTSGGMAVGFYTYGVTAGPSLLAFILDSKGDWFNGSVITGEAVATGDGATKDFATKYSMPQNATVYVDGEPVAATVDSVPLMYNDMGAYFVLIEDGNPAGPGDYNYGVVGVSKNGATTTGQARVGYSIWYNPFYALGIASFRQEINPTNLEVEVSDDLVNWTQLTLANISQVTNVPDALQHKKYWRVNAWNGTAIRNCVYEMTSGSLTGKNIHFATPPAPGAVITADYTTKVIAKDDQHVFDIAMTINFGEYNP